MTECPFCGGDVRKCPCPGSPEDFERTVALMAAKGPALFGSPEKCLDGTLLLLVRGLPSYVSRRDVAAAVGVLLSLYSRLRPQLDDPEKVIERIVAARVPQGAADALRRDDPITVFNAYQSLKNARNDPELRADIATQTARFLRDMPELRHKKGTEVKHALVLIAALQIYEHALRALARMGAKGESNERS